MGGKYLNVDVEVYSRIDLTPLREELGDRVDVMFCGETEPGKYLLSIELAGVYNESEVEHTAKSLCHLIEDLSAPAKKAWDSADDRVFDVGFDAVIDSRCGQALLSPETLQKIGRLNARLAVSIYTTSLQQNQSLSTT